jgi:hypothetical protein
MLTDTATLHPLCIADLLGKRITQKVHLLVIANSKSILTIYSHAPLLHETMLCKNTPHSPKQATAAIQANKRSKSSKQASCTPWQEKQRSNTSTPCITTHAYKD